MSRRRSFLLILFGLMALSLTAFSGCNGSAANNTTAAPQNPTATTQAVPSSNTSAGPMQNNIEPRQVAVGAGFAIILGEDATSGYLWEANFNTAYIEQVSTDYAAPDSPATGGGERTFRFKAMKKGTTAIVMQLKRAGDELAKDSKISLFAIDEPLPNTIRDAGSVKTNEDEQFTLSLDELNTRGFQWEAVFDTAFLQLITSTRNQDSGQRTFQVGALKPGITALILILGGIETPQEILVDTITIGLPAK
jgi:predicted secreted protein